MHLLFRIGQTPMFQSGSRALARTNLGVDRREQANSRFQTPDRWKYTLAISHKPGSRSLRGSRLLQRPRHYQFRRERLAGTQMFLKVS